MSKGKKRHANGTISFDKEWSAPIAVKHTLQLCTSIIVIRLRRSSQLQLLYKWQKYQAIEKEIKKCIVLCANCHVIRHYEYNRGNVLDLGVAGQFEQIEAELQVTDEEEAIHHMYFNTDKCSSMRKHSDTLLMSECL